MFSKHKYIIHSYINEMHKRNLKWSGNFHFLCKKRTFSVYIYIYKHRWSMVVEYNERNYYREAFKKWCKIVAKLSVTKGWERLHKERETTQLWYQHTIFVSCVNELVYTFIQSSFHTYEKHWQHAISHYCVTTRRNFLVTTHGFPNGWCSGGETYVSVSITDTRASC